jgi:Bacterial Ig-like domain (group 2)
VRRWAVLTTALWVLGCSDLTEGAGGVVALEIIAPAGVSTVEVDQTLQLTARPLDKDGNTVAAPVTWQAADPTLTVDATGLITGVSVGIGRVQAFTSSLASPILSFTVTAPVVPPVVLPLVTPRE